VAERLEKPQAFVSRCESGNYIFLERIAIKDPVIRIAVLGKSKLHGLFAEYPIMRKQKYGIIAAYQESV
jgi:hypothetical protein